MSHHFEFLPTTARSNQGLLFMDTVQTSSPWRPQLPLPKDITVHVQDMDKSSKKEGRKWSLGNLFRRKKKDIESENSSSEEDKKPGFASQKKSLTLNNSHKKKKRASKIVGAFDHIVLSPGQIQNQNTIDRYRETTESINSTEKYGSLDRRIRRERNTPAQVEVLESSGDEESHHSSSMSRFRSDDSLGNHSGNSNRRSRTARTERYLKRLSKDEGNSPVNMSTRWHTQPVSPSVFHGSINSVDNSYRRGYGVSPASLRSSASLTNVPHTQIISPNQYSHHQPYRNVNPTATYENSFYIQSKANYRSPPPIPPRDPQRRLTISNSLDGRPISYNFDKALSPVPNNIWQVNGRAISDDRLWGANNPIPIPPRPSSVQSEAQPKRFISRHPPNNSFNGHHHTPVNPTHEYKYVTDVAPRSRRPIAVIPNVPQQSAFTPTRPIKPVEDFRTPSQPTQPVYWRRQVNDGQNNERRGRTVERKTSPHQPVVSPRSVSSSKALEVMNKRNVELTKELNNLLGDENGQDEVDNVVSGRLYLRQSENPNPGFNKGSKEKVYEVKVKNRVSPPKKVISPQPPPQAVYKKYDSKKTPPEPPQRSVSKRSSLSEEELAKKRKSGNLEEAINELEEIYKSLKLSDEDLLDRAELRDVPTPSLNKIQKLKDYDDEEEEDDGKEPDIILDDLSYRTLKRANSAIKVPEVQPLFGIPIGPIPPSPNTDYTNLQPPKQNKPRFIPQRSPDLVADDLAYRNLRKDRDLPSCGVDRIRHSVSTSPEDKSKKRSLSANIFSLIQRDAAKPSGGNLDDYFDVDYINSITKKDDEDGVFVVPKKVEKKKSVSPSAYYDKNKGGAVFNLPSTLNRRKSPTPDSVDEGQKSEFENILNAIAMEAKSTSEKLGQDLAELRKETQSVSSGTSSEGKKKSTKPIARKERIEEIERVAEAASVCQKMIQDVVDPKENKLNTNDMIKEIDDTSDCALMCHAMINRVITPQAPTPSKAPEKSILSNLIKELSPNEEETFEILSQRCKAQLDQLDAPKYNDADYYDNLISIDSDSDSRKNDEEIDLIMAECEAESSVQIKINDGLLLQVPRIRVQDHKDDSSLDYNDSSPLDPKSSSDFVKSSSETENLLTTYSILSSSDGLKSTSSHSSSDIRVQSESVKSTTSAESAIAETVPSEIAQATNLIQQNMTPSPPLRLTPSGDESMYNSSEELAMIFGIKSPTPSGNNSEDLMLLTCGEHGITLTNINNNSIKPDKSVWDSYRTNFNNNLDTIIEELHENDSNNNNTNPEIESNTTDSGNVSLNDFSSEYTFVNEIQIEASSSIVVKKEEEKEEVFKSEISIVSSSLELEKELEPIESKTNNKIRERKPRFDDITEIDSREAGCSSASSTNSNNKKHSNAKVVLSDRNNNSLLQPQHVLLACTYGLANDIGIDYITIIAIIIAIITILALIIF